MTAAARTVGKALTERLTGFGPSRIRAGAAAGVVGVASAVATYRLLRAGS
jgi:hypothetical protein